MVSEYCGAICVLQRNIRLLQRNIRIALRIAGGVADRGAEHAHGGGGGAEETPPVRQARRLAYIYIYIIIFNNDT